MDLRNFQKRALEIRKKYELLETKKYKKVWSNKQLAKGFIKDAKDLFESIKKNNKKQINHELSDCLWSILILAHKYKINLEKSFIKNMNNLENKIKRELKSIINNSL